jgi:O-antigen/teichoic acid export membrane protein
VQTSRQPNVAEVHPAPTVTRADLDRSFVDGIAWTSIVTWLGQIVSWGSTLVVVHYLVPTDYGLVGMALLYLGLVQMASELGLGAAVVQFRELTTDQIRQFNGLSVIAGACGVLVSLAVAIPMGHFFREPRLPLVIAVMGSVFFISGFKIVPQALLQKQLQFRKLAVIEGAQSLVGAASTLTMAVLGFGYWTLVFGMVISATVFSVLVVLQNPTGFRRPRFASIRLPFTFSSHMLVARFAWYGYDNADFAVIGKVLGTTALGGYTLGWTLSGMAVEKITSLIGRVTPAFFSAVQNDLEEMRRYLLLLTEGLALLTFPMCIGLALTARDIVRVALGPQWTIAILPLQLLAILATIRSVQPLIPQVLATMGEARTNMRNALLTLLILPGAFFLATRWGIAGVASAWLILGPLTLSPLMVRAFRLIKLPPGSYFGSLWPATSSCLVMACAVITVDRAFLGSAPLHVSLITKILIGAASYVIALFVIHRKRLLVLREVFRLFRGRPSPHSHPSVEAAAISVRAERSAHPAQSAP